MQHKPADMSAFNVPGSWPDGPATILKKRNAAVWERLLLTQEVQESITSGYELVLVGTDLKLLYAPEELYTSGVPPIPLFLQLLKLDEAGVKHEHILSLETINKIKEQTNVTILQGLRHDLSDCLNIGSSEVYALYSSRIDELQCIYVVLSDKSSDSDTSFTLGIEFSLSPLDSTQSAKKAYLKGKALMGNLFNPNPKGGIWDVMIAYLQRQKYMQEIKK